MGNRTQKLLQGFSGLLGHRNRETPRAERETAADGVQTAKDSVTGRFSSELFASLLLELPEHRQALLNARAGEDISELGRCTHKLLGAVVYCDLPELAGALRALQQAIRCEDTDAITPACNASIRAIDTVLSKSGLAL
jgi:HPt (histidine-containing phosphotransfer) domain-containing protein